MATPKKSVDLRRAKSLYVTHKQTLRQVGAALGVDHRVVRRELDDAGVKIRPRHNQ